MPWTLLRNYTSRRKCRHLKSPRSVTVSSASRSHSGCVSHQSILSIPIPLFHDNSPFPSPRYNLTLKIQGQRYPSQRSIQLTHFLSVSHQGIPLTPVPFAPWQSGLPFLRIWPWKLKVKGEGQRYPSQRSIQLTHFLFCFTSIGPTIPKIWQIEGSTGEKQIGNFTKKFAKNKIFEKLLENLLIKWKAWQGKYIYQAL